MELSSKVNFYYFYYYLGKQYYVCPFCNTAQVIEYIEFYNAHRQHLCQCDDMSKRILFHNKLFYLENQINIFQELIVIDDDKLFLLEN